MIIFLLGAACMMLAAYVLVLPAVMKSRQDESVDQDQVNLALAREQLRDLEADRANEKIDVETFNQLKSELEQNLLQNVDLDRIQSDAKGKSSPLTLIALIVLIPLISLAVYLNTGSRLALDDVARAEFLAQQEAAATPDIEAMVAQLAERLKAAPDDGEGWWMLGRSYLVMGQLEDAKLAFAKALPLQDGNADLMADFADTLGRLNQSDLTGEAKPLILRALKLDPNQQKARWLAGLLAFQEERYAEVEDLMAPLMAVTDENSEIQASIQRLIDEASSRLGEGVSPTASLKAQADDAAQRLSASAGETDETAVIRVSIELDPTLALDIQQDDTVFVFARAVQGPPMPLAAQKLRVSDLPVTVTLDDSLAMRPGMGISSQDKVTVVARVSRSGQPMASSGDIQGQVENVATRDDSAIIVQINTRVP